MIGHKVYGNGPRKVVVLHDWFGDSTNYDFMLPCLDIQAFTYVFMDLRGYGRSKNLAGECTVEEGAADVLVLADFLRWPVFDIVSHSMSALIAQYLSLNERIKRIVAITPVPACGAPVPEAVLAFLEDAALRNQVSARQIIQFMTGYRQPSTFVEQKVQQWYETSNPQARAAYLRMFSQTNFSDHIKGVKTPFLVLVGAHDAEAYGEPVMQQTFLNWYPNAELKILKGCGHYPMQETPKVLAQMVQEYLLPS